MLDTYLVPENTLITGKGDSAAVDVSGAANRAFLLTLNIAKVIEQESIELTVFTSPDAATWDPKPLTSLPQKFYPGDYPLLVDLSQKPEAKFIRVHWDVNRWGRGTPNPEFTVSLRLREIPAELLEEARAEATTRR